MLLNGRLAEGEGIGPRPVPAILSLLIHVLAVVFIVFSGPLEMPKTKTAFQLAVEGHEQKLVWYHFKEKLPAVKPVRAQKDNRPLRAETKMANQSIVSSPKNAPKAPQMIWQPAPEINTDIKFDSANLVAVSLPKIDPPKQFVPPTQKPKLYSPQPDTSATPPELQALDNKQADLADARLPRAVRDFQAPAPTAKAATHPITETAPPELQAGAAKPVDIARAGELGQVDRPYREFRPPPARPRPGLPSIRYEDPAPSQAAASNAGTGGAIASLGVETQLEKVYRPFSAPDAGGQGSGSRGRPGVSVPVVPAAPSIDASGNAPGDLNVAVVGLNPGNHLPNLPPISRPADFSAGPKLNPNGGSGDGSGSASVSVPDLTIRNGGKIDSRSGIMAMNTPPPRAGLPTEADALREAAKYITVDSIGRPSAARVSNAPDSRFDGRTVYMMAIQMPNITSYVGSWLMWYSERSARPVSTSAITPPFAHRKVDPKYIRTAADERVQGTVRLGAVIRKDGTVGGVELLKGIDERLDLTAEEALGKWQFTPAMRDGIPIDVDIVVEIPFRLAPQTADK